MKIEKKTLMANLELQLAKAETDLMKMFVGIDLLDEKEVVSRLKIYEKTVKIIQKDFISKISNYLQELPNREAREINMEGNPRLLKELSAGVGGSVLTYSVVSGITVTQSTGWWIFSSTTSVPLSSVLAASLGVSTSVVTGGLSIVGGAISIIVTNKLFKNSRRKKILCNLKKSISDFNSKIITEMKEIFDEIGEQI